MIAFASPALAEAFLAMTGLRDQVVLPVPTLGDQNHSLIPNPKVPLPNPSLKIVFPSDDVLENWHNDKEGFDTSPYVSDFNICKA